MTLNTSTVTAWQDAEASQYNNLRKDVIEKSWDRTVTTWSANAYVLAADAQIIALVAWQRYVFNANFTNTSSCTLNVNSLWAVAIKDLKNNDLWSWAITSWNEVEVMYDWSSMIVLSWVSATENNEWTSKIATNVEAIARTNTENQVVPIQLFDSNSIIISSPAVTAWNTSDVSYPHWLVRAPKLTTFLSHKSTTDFSSWSYDWTTNKHVAQDATNDTTFCIRISTHDFAEVLSVDATNINMRWTAGVSWGWISSWGSASIVTVIW